MKFLKFLKRLGWKLFPPFPPLSPCCKEPMRWRTNQELVALAKEKGLDEFAAAVLNMSGTLKDYVCPECGKDYNITV